MYVNLFMQGFGVCEKTVQYFFPEFGPNTAFYRIAHNLPFQSEGF